MLFTAEFETDLPIQEIEKTLRFGSLTDDNNRHEVGIHYKIDGARIRGIIVSNSEDRLYKITSGFLKIRKLYNRMQMGNHMIFKSHLTISTAQSIDEREAIAIMFWADKFPMDVKQNVPLSDLLKSGDKPWNGEILPQPMKTITTEELSIGQDFGADPIISNAETIFGKD